MQAKIICHILFLSLLPGFLHAAHVSVKKSSSAWTLNVDGKPFFVKGVGCNTAKGEKGSDYLLMAKEMGANSVRTWGITPKSYFDQAHKYGLKVNAGVWFNAIRGTMTDSYLNADYCAKLKKETLQHVRELKKHPALLTWNLGNEVFAFTESDKERAAFGVFLENLIQAVHKEDPHHPVVYACSGTTDLKELKARVPSLDIVGANVYGAYSYVLQWMKANNYERPVMATEFGPFGDWDRMRDENGQPFDPYDQYKATNYTNLWKDIERNRNYSLGGYAFVLGDMRNQASLTWYNINFEDKKRQGYWALYEAYTGEKTANRCPKIRLLKADRINHLHPGEVIQIELISFDPDGDPTEIHTFITDIATDPLIVQPARFYPTQAERLKSGLYRITVPNDPGLYRLYATVEDGQGNIAVGNLSIDVIPLSTEGQPNRLP